MRGVASVLDICRGPHPSDASARLETLGSLVEGVAKGSRRECVKPTQGPMVHSAKAKAKCPLPIAA
jgi:hypothetical protein